MDTTKLPVHCTSQKSLDDTVPKIFEDWLHNFFVSYVRKFCSDNGIEYKIVLLLIYRF